MAQQVTVRLSRSDASPWGFRLQGGKDFGQQLLIQKVNGGSLAEKAGLQVGDALIKVNTTEVYNMKHKEAQDTLVRAGNSFEVTVQRGGQTLWKPQVSAVGSLPSPGGASPQNVTRTSLTKPMLPTTPIGSGHNVSPRPFATTPQMNGGDSVKAIVNKQYNTPVGMYSEETIAETLSAQAEVLAGGVLGVNFKKNERTYDSQKSEVYKMVQEVDKEPREPEPAPMSNTKYFSTISHAVGGRATSPRPRTPIAQQMGTPEPPQDKPYMPPQTASGTNPQCTDCGKSIVGVFVRIKDKNLHVECFKCATCGTSLKNVGYYNINNKLYCDIHAKLVARQNPPAPNLDPVTIPPGAKIPSGVFSSPTMPSLGSPAPQSPQPSTLGPLPFHAPRLGTSHVSIPRLGPQSPASPGQVPKPFGAPQPVAPPPSSVPFSAPSIPAANILPKPQAPDHGHSVVWPPCSKNQPQSVLQPLKQPKSSEQKKSLLSAENIVTLKSEDMEDPPVGIDYQKRMSLCSQEVSSFSGQRIQRSEHSSLICESSDEHPRPTSPVPDKQVALPTITEVSSAFETKGFVQQMNVRKTQYSSGKISHGEHVEKVRKTAGGESYSNISKSGSAHMEKSSMRSVVRERSSTPELLDMSSKPHEIRSLLPPASAVRPMTPTQVVVFPPEIPVDLPKARSRTATPIQVQEKSQYEIDHKSKTEIMSKEVKHLGSQREISGTEKVFTKSEVEKIVKEEVEKILETKMKETKVSESKSEAIRISDLPKPVMPSGPMASALCTASDRPFTPIQPPKPIQLPTPKPPPPVSKEPVPLPPETKPYFPPPPPPPDHESLDERTARALREVDCRSPMTEALTVAPERPYSPLPAATTALSFTSSTTLDTKTTFQPITETATSRGKKQISMLSALTVAPQVPFTVPGKTPIPTTNNEVEARVSGAFKPLPSSSATSLIPKPTPLSDNGGTVTVVHQKPKYFPAVTYVPKPSLEPLTLVNRPTEPQAPKQIASHGPTKSVQSITKTQIAMSESMKTTGLHSPDLLPYYQKNIGQSPSPKPQKSPAPPSVQYSSLYKSKVQSTKAMFDKGVVSSSSQQKVQAKAVKSDDSELKLEPPSVIKIMEETKKKPPTRMQSPSLLPYYQENIGEIPVRNRSISPVPHLIRAPMINPTPLYPPQKQQPQKQFKPFSTANLKASNVKASTSAKVVSSASHQPSPLVKSHAEKQMVNISSARQVFKPEINYQLSSYQQSSVKELHKSVTRETVTKERPLSPWRAEVRTVQNLSPFEVRLPSPRPISKPVNVSSNVNPPSGVVKPSPSSCPVPVGGSSSGGTTGGGKGGSVAGATAPRRGRGVLNAAIPPGGRVPVCGHCNNQIRGPFITALGKIWCPEHFLCVNAKCRRPLQDIGFVEESEGLYCEFCFEQYLAPTCSKCNSKIKGDCLNAIGKQFHPECFCCAYCGKLFGNNPFFLEDALPYCETDWNELFTTKCFSCGFPIEAGDRWVEALNNNYHSQCFNCTTCKKNLEGQSFFAKGGRPFCKNHVR